MTDETTQEGAAADEPRQAGRHFRSPSPAGEAQGEAPVREEYVRGAHAAPKHAAPAHAAPQVADPFAPDDAVGTPAPAPLASEPLAASKAAAERADLGETSAFLKAASAPLIPRGPVRAAEPTEAKPARHFAPKGDAPTAAVPVVPTASPVESTAVSEPLGESDSVIGATAVEAVAKVVPVPLQKGVAKMAGGVRSERAGGKRPKRRRSSLALAFSNVLIVVGLVLLLVAAGLFVFTQLGYRKATESYDELGQYAVLDGEAADDGATLPDVDFTALAEINPDIVGWIYAPTMNVSYPVVQTDNNEKYLNTLFDGTQNASGAIFMDCDDTAPGMVDQQTTIYGHHMMNDTMFNFVDRAQRSQDEFNQVDKVYYITPDTTYEFDPLFCTLVDPERSDVRRANFDSTEDLVSYLEDLFGTASVSADDAGERLATCERVMTLVTCNYGFGSSDRSVMVIAPSDSYLTP